MRRIKLTVRDLFWLVLAVSLALGWLQDALRNYGEPPTNVSSARVFPY